MAKSNKKNVKISKDSLKENNSLKTENHKIESNFPVVGIGSSAGGLEALKNFFEKMPDDTGMAFILIQHLDPSHESSMVSLLGRNTGMEVIQVKDGMKVQPNRVYVIPPNKDMGIIKGVLQLFHPEQPHGLRTPINYFFHNLAEDQKDNAIAIIFSGYGSDGTNGIKAIKAEGGMTMAQDPKTSISDAMPLNAIRTKLIDFVLPPEMMPKQLIDYTKRSYTQPLKRIKDEETINSIQKILILIRNKTGHDFSHYKDSTINRRIARRMNIHQIDKVSDYFRFIQKNSNEVDVLFKELLINVTSFFREPKAFEAVKKSLKKLLKDKKSGYNLRVWVPGCSTGEEVYSIGIILQECMEELERIYEIQLFGTDIDENAIEIARQGLYPSSISKDVSEERLNKFFIPEHTKFRIKKNIREMAIFAPHNVLSNPPFTKLDLLSCRNLLIYLDKEIQKKLLSSFHYVLKSGGILFLGTSETVGENTYLFDVVDKKWKIYTGKKLAHIPHEFIGIHHTTPPYLKDTYDALGKETMSLDVNMIQKVEKILVDKYAPSAVIIDKKGEIIYIHGKVGNYLEPAPGKASLNILDMARDDIKFEIRSALFDALTKNSEVISKGLQIKSNDHFNFFNLIVAPFDEPILVQDLFMVVFEEMDIPKNSIKVPAYITGNAVDNKIVELEKKLELTRERLNNTIQERETSNEELKSANEELQSMNEELQSTNEEMESSKEELQSLNEELMTVNSELQVKMDKLSELNDDINNFLNSTQIATVFLDKKLKIKRFTNEATKLVNVIDSDIGRPFSDISSKLIYEGIHDDIKLVLARLNSIEKEIQTKDGKWYLIRVMPYKTSEDMIGGVLITIIDINEQKKVQNMLSTYASFVEKSASLIVTIDKKGYFEYVNPQFERITGYNSKDIIGKHLNLLQPYGPEKKDFVKFLNAITLEKEWQGIIPLSRKDGEIFWEFASIKPIKTVEGDVINYIKTGLQVKDVKFDKLNSIKFKKRN
jgi:two-component system CheB/CheR fusion protein